MSKTPKSIGKTDDTVTKVVTRAARGTTNTLGQPKESAAGKSTPAPVPPEVTLDNLLLIPKIIQLLGPALEKLGFPLKESKTANRFTRKMMSHHVIETSHGKIALIYVAPEILLGYRSEITNLGFVFVEEFKLGAFIFSLASDLQREYKPTIESWQVIFQKVAIFLQEDIVEFEEMDEEFLQKDLKEKFALPDSAAAAESGEMAAFDHQKLFGLIKKSFSSGELNEICFKLDSTLSFDDIRGMKTLDEGIIALIQHCQRKEQLPQLVAICQNERPEDPWDVFPRN